MWVGGGAPPRRVERIVASVAALGVLLVVAAVASSARRGSSGGEVHPLGLRVVGDVVIGLVAAVALLSVALLVDLLVSLRRRRFAATDPVLAASPRSWWERMLLSLVGMVVLVGGLLVARGLYGELGGQLDGQGNRPWPPGPPGSRSVSEAQVDWPVVGAVVLVVTGAAVASMVAGRRRRLAATRAAPRRAATAEVAADGVALGAVEAAALDELRREPDPRRAVIRAYGAMGAVLASWGYPRRPSETPFEFLERTLVGLGASAGAARRLTVLFEWARFSQHPVTDASKAEAIDAVGELRGEAVG